LYLLLVSCHFVSKDSSHYELNVYTLYAVRLDMMIEVEADNIRANYKNYGLQYISYELQLPPHFPLPFVSETAREGLFFTTIVRDPFKVSSYHYID